MALKVSIFTTMKDPISRGDLFEEALQCFWEFADELVIVNGSEDDDYIFAEKNVKVVNYPWPEEFTWDFIGQQFQRGYEACSGDWVIHMDMDFLFHEKTFPQIRQALADHNEYPALSFYKWQFILPDRYNLKSRLVLAVNKAVFGDRIRFDSGGDLCQPSLDGQQIMADDVPPAEVPFYNYEHLIKTIAQTTDDVSRMDRAYNRYFDKDLYALDGFTAFEGWIQMMIGRFERPSKHIALADHPKYIQETIKNLRPVQFGYSGFGYLRLNDYVKEGFNNA
jgi:glycosyltransferase involved in cell wall biosynthesis